MPARFETDALLIVIFVFESTCSKRVFLYLSLNVKDEKVLDFGYQCKSCVYCQASVSLLSSNVINKSIDNFKPLLSFAEKFFVDENITFPKQWASFKQIFDKKNKSRKDCLLLPFKTLSRALKL